MLDGYCKITNQIIHILLSLNKTNSCPVISEIYENKKRIKAFSIDATENSRKDNNLVYLHCYMRCF